MNLGRNQSRRTMAGKIVPPPDRRQGNSSSRTSRLAEKSSICWEDA